MAQTLVNVRMDEDGKKTMEENSDVFIAMPGGYGTLEEISEIIVGKQKDFDNEIKKAEDTSPKNKTSLPSALIHRIIKK